MPGKKLVVVKAILTLLMIAVGYSITQELHASLDHAVAIKLAQHQNVSSIDMTQLHIAFVLATLAIAGLAFAGIKKAITFKVSDVNS